MSAAKRQLILEIKHDRDDVKRKESSAMTLRRSLLTLQNQKLAKGGDPQTDRAIADLKRKIDSYDRDISAL
jgi:hypothetical protein